MKITCPNPNHKDATPSCHVYADGLHCFVCGYNSNSPEVTIGLQEKIKSLKQKEPENIEEKIKYIKSLPLSSVRGLSMHVSREGYYIIWPTECYYKFRRYDDRPRYVGPRGHRPPVFWIKPELPSKTLVIIEGEINALSLEKSIQNHGFHIASPGSATELPRHLEFYLQFSNICIIVDRDPPGVYYGLELKKQLIKHKKKVMLVAVEEDFNEKLQKSGEEGLKKYFQELVGA